MGVRKAKSEAKTSMRTDVAVASVYRLAGDARPGRAGHRMTSRRRGHIAELDLSTGDGPLRVAVTL
jgi:hypothetical protein